MNGRTVIALINITILTVVLAKHSTIISGWLAVAAANIPNILIGLVVVPAGAALFLFAMLTIKPRPGGR